MDHKEWDYYRRYKLLPFIENASKKFICSIEGCEKKLCLDIVQHLKEHEQGLCVPLITEVKFKLPPSVKKEENNEMDALELLGNKYGKELFARNQYRKFTCFFKGCSLDRISLICPHVQWHETEQHQVDTEISTNLVQRYLKRKQILDQRAERVIKRISIEKDNSISIKWENPGTTPLTINHSCQQTCTIKKEPVETRTIQTQLPVSDIKTESNEPTEEKRDMEMEIFGDILKEPIF